MPTVRWRDAEEYPEPAQKLFELSKGWPGGDRSRGHDASAGTNRHGHGAAGLISPGASYQS